MDRPTPHTDILQALFKKQKIATLDELKEAIDTTSTMTVFRRLKDLGYRTSYSHRGKYYTLVKIPKFDDDGLWSYRSVAFSQFGNLLHTAQHFVEQADAGFAAAELQSYLHVDVKQCLLQLIQQKKLRREKIDGHFIYLAGNKQQRSHQKRQRTEYLAASAIGGSPLGEDLSQELNAAIILFNSLLDEKQRRLYAGLESFKLGHGGDRKIAEFLGLDVHTVARGRRELFAGDVQQNRAFAIRGRAGYWWKKNAASNRHDCQLLEHDTAGDPISGLKWTRKTTEKIAAQLKQLNIEVSPNTVGRLLKQMGYSLRVNHKKVESGNKNPHPHCRRRGGVHQPIDLLQRRSRPARDR